MDPESTFLATTVEDATVIAEPVLPAADAEAATGETAADSLAADTEAISPAADLEAASVETTADSLAANAETVAPVDSETDQQFSNAAGTWPETVKRVLSIPPAEGPAVFRPAPPRAVNSPYFPSISPKPGEASSHRPVPVSSAPRPRRKFSGRVLWAPAGRVLKRIPRSILITAGLALALGGYFGHKATHWRAQNEVRQLQAAVAEAQRQSQTRKDDRISGLAAERDRLASDLARVAAYSVDYPEGSIPRALALAAAEEFKIADTLLLQQAAALESGAKVTLVLKQTAPDPDLAVTLEGEMKKLEAEIAEQWQAARGLAEDPRMLAETSVATQMVSLAILNRNYLIARYGLNSPVPLQYQSAKSKAARLEQTSQAASGGDAGQIAADIRDLRLENERLRAENEMLLNSDSTLYASAISDLGAGQLRPAEEKLKRLVEMFPASSLVPKAREGLDLVKVKAAEKEAARKPPVEVFATGVRHDGGYFKNESYVRISFKNVSPLMVKKVEFKVLTFDEHGYPVASQRMGLPQDNRLDAAVSENVASGRGDYGVWQLSEKVRQVKVRLKEVEFYEAPAWQDEDLDFWVEKEGARFRSEEPVDPALKNEPQKGPKNGNARRARLTRTR